MSGGGDQIQVSTALLGDMQVIALSRLALALSEEATNRHVQSFFREMAIESKGVVDRRFATLAALEAELEGIDGGEE